MSLRNALLPALLLMLPVLPTAALADGALVTSWTPIAPPPPTEPRVSTAAYAAAATPVTPAPVSSATAAPASAAIAPGPSIELPPEAELYANGEPLTEWYGADLPGGHADLWERIRAGFAMEEVDSSLVQRHEAWYLNRPDYVERMVDRAGRYLYHIVEEVEKRDMPTEIALLPMIESAYNPVAQSHMRAAGMWQFIPSTGRKYGLKQTWWYDGRRDVLAATQAALDYLQFLHDTFGSWELALAAYNCGEGKVQRAIDYNRKKRRPTDYAHLRLPKETRNYLPKLQAIKNIIADPKLVGIDLQPVPNRPYFTVVEAPPHIDVAMAAKLADMPVEEFRSLNPAHNRPVITPVGNHQLLVPIDKAEVFQANLESNEDPLVSWQSYELKRGEKLATVARKFDISLQRLEEVNGLSGRKRVRPGQMLLVPLEEAEVESNLDETYKHPDFQAPANDYRGRLVYRVKAGDTLSSIARRYGTTVKDIKAWNRLKSDHLQVGQRLNIWKDAKPPRRRTARG